MKNKIKIEGLNTQYSLIIVETSFKGLWACYTKHIVSNNGWHPLLYWVKYFENNF